MSRRLSYAEIMAGLDTLFMTSMCSDITEDANMRAEAIEEFLSANGWSFDEIVDRLAHEDPYTLPACAFAVDPDTETN